MWCESYGATGINIDIDWGDGTSDNGVTTQTKTHEYPVTGGTTVYEVKVKNSTGTWFNNSANSYKAKLTGFKQWGSTTTLNTLYGAFRSCVNMTYTPTDTPAGQPSSIYEGFRNCSSITTLDISSFDLSQCTSLVHAFSDSEYITNFKLPTDLSSVTSCLRMCWKTGKSSTGTVFDLDGLNFSSCTTFSYAFNDTIMNAGSTFANWTLNPTSNVSLQAAFMGEASALSDTLTTADFSGWTNTASINSMYNTFYDREKWTTLDITGMEATNTASWYCTFREMRACESIIGLSSLDASNATLIERMFENCENLSFGDIGSSTNFGANWGPNLSSVTNMKYLFVNVGKNAASAKGPDLSNWDTSGVTTNGIFEMFKGAVLPGDTAGNAITKMDLSGWDLSGGITTLFSFMYNNKGLSPEIDLSNAAFTNSLISMQSAFYTASGTTRDFTHITLGSSSDFSNVTTLQNAFRNNTSLTLILPTNLDLTNLVNCTNMATDTTIDTAGYDRFLERLDATWNTALTAGTINAGTNTKYTAGGTAEAAHTSLALNGWNIVDGGSV